MYTLYSVEENEFLHIIWKNPVYVSVLLARALQFHLSSKFESPSLMQEYPRSPSAKIPCVV